MPGCPRATRTGVSRRAYPTLPGCAPLTCTGSLHLSAERIPVLAWALLTFDFFSGGRLW
jgi:hypothetical protein